MASKAENAKSEKVLVDLMQNLTIAKEAEQIKESSTAIATFINGHIEDLDVPSKTIDALQKQLNNKKDAVVREKALYAVQAIAQHAQVSPAVEPFLVVLLPAVMAGAGDKITAVKTAAFAAALAIAGALSPNAVKVALPPVLESLRNAQKFPERLLALDFIDTLIRTSKIQMGTRVPDLIPAVSEAMWVTKKEVSVRAYKTMEAVCNLIDNKDIEQFIPELIKCIAKPENVPETVHKLGATTFVADVHQPTLALMVPLLDRGLAERETAIRRKSAVIIDNMCKVVDDPNIVAPFLPKMMPGLRKNYETLADPEAREKTRQALDTIKRVGNVVDDKIPEPSNYGDIEVVKAHLLAVLGKKGAEAKFAPVIAYIAGIAGQLIDDKETDAQVWTSNLKSYVSVIVGDAEADTAVNNLRLKAQPDATDADAEEDDEEGEDLCNCTFKLAYGAKILLTQTHLRLKRGQRYGLCGPNGSGKSTLMRAINNEKLEGFPKQSEVRTAFVEHDLDSEDADIITIEWTMMKLKEAKKKIDDAEESTDKAEFVLPTTDAVVEQLKEFGFTEQMINGPVGSLSGGWKMKLALCRAVFLKPDILLLDEPTNHLDVKNVKWLEDYLCNSPCTSIMVSHDSGFLDNVCQHIINYERFKLKRYRGNLKEFVRRVPSAKSYYELGASELEFTFPEPGFLEGVKTKAKAILRATNMSFQYPNTPKPQISDITFQCSLSSRIAVIGPNGAGKSTLVNVLTGELVPTGGEIYQHENIRIAYIKQHAFAHIDNHLDETPYKYIEWRFGSGEDRETLDRASKIITKEDEKMRDHIYMINGTQRRVDKIHSRRKLKNSYEYECSFLLGEGFGDKIKWTPMMSADNEWLPRSELLKTHQKDVIKVDEAEALASGQFRPLIQKEVVEHASMFGLDEELVLHSRMSGLSGGQRVKVVLAACTWQRPHLIVLDEPTNYLDRDSLGALSKALKKFEGGVIIISHSAEFTKDLTEEVWAVLDGKMTPSGHNWVQGQGSGPRIKTDDGDEEDKFDAMGNKIAGTKKKAKLTSSEARKKKKERMARRKRGEEVFSDEED
ncbi:translational elongation factor EF-1 alpha [Sporothrix curviconia]|uniref:Translational elongation factor EF-1 alpha n=2 Tax=Sporothrix curviconia TaxID=1260050 RepID=A0ABP0AUS1_9PEZI